MNPTTRPGFEEFELYLDDKLKDLYTNWKEYRKLWLSEEEIKKEFISDRIDFFLSECKMKLEALERTWAEKNIQGR